MGLADGRGSQGVEFCIHAKFSILQSIRPRTTSFVVRVQRGFSLKLPCYQHAHKAADSGQGLRSADKIKR